MSDGKRLVPTLRFPDFLDKGGWPLKKLGNYLTESRLSGSKGDVAKKITVKLWGNGVFEKSEAVQGSVNTQYFQRKAGQFIYSKLDFLNQAFGIIPEHLDNYESTVDLPCFDFAGELVPAFLLEYVSRKEFYEKVGETADGSRKAKRIHAETFLSFRVALPSLAEQKKISDCLGSLDDLIAAQACKVKTLEIHRTGLMQQLFPCEGENLPRLRFPSFRDSAEWRASKIGKLVDEGWLYPPRDGNHGNIHPKSSDYVPEGIPFIMASDLKDGKVDIEGCHFIEEELADRLKKGFAKEGDVLLTHKGTVGAVAIVPAIPMPYLMLTPQVTYFRVRNKEKLSNAFLVHLFCNPVFQKNLLKASGGGTRSYIGIIEQANLPVTLPGDIDEQQCIANALGHLNDQIAAQRQQLDALRRHKDGLMQRLFPLTSALDA